MEPKKSTFISYDSLAGLTGRLVLEGEETYLIIRRGEQTIDINFKRHLISIYWDDQWTVLPMDSNSQATSLKTLSHIDQLVK